MAKGRRRDEELMDCLGVVKAEMGTKKVWEYEGGGRRLVIVVIPSNGGNTRSGNKGENLSVVKKGGQLAPWGIKRLTSAVRGG